MSTNEMLQRGESATGDVNKWDVIEGGFLQRDIKKWDVKEEGCRGVLLQHDTKKWGVAEGGRHSATSKNKDEYNIIEGTVFLAISKNQI